MTKKTFLLIAFAVAVVGAILYLNKDSFGRVPIQISHRFHAFGGRFGSDSAAAPVMFEFNRQLKLTCVKVVPLAAAGTNRFVQPVWHLVSDSNSVPTKGFLYGTAVPGMRSALRGVVADPLDPSITYRLIIQAGSLKAQHDFALDKTL